MKFNIAKQTTVENLLSEKFKGISKSRMKQILKFKQITCNGVALDRMNQVLEAHSQVEVDFTKDPMVGKKVKPQFKLLWEDKYMLAAVKPAGLLTVGKPNSRVPSFYSMVQSFVRDNSKNREQVFILHRLDREVSGIVLFAKSEEVQSIVKRHWRENVKLYRALVHGHVAQDEGKMESYLMEDPVSLKMYSSQNAPQGKLAVTLYRKIKIVGENTLLEIKLQTGRKNQIRVHMSDMGHPIVGDRRYGADSTYERQIRLCAYYHKFKHPITKKWVEIEAPLPLNFLKLQERDEDYK